MAGCKIVNQSVVEAVNEIREIYDSYKNAGEEFIKDLNNAIAEMEGETKDALKKFIDTDVNTFVAIDLPDAVNAMAELLELNRTNFVDVDKSIADSINGN